MSEAVVEEGEDLLEPLRAELLHPFQVVVGQRHPQGLDAGVLLLRAQVRVALKVWIKVCIRLISAHEPFINS